MDQETRDHLYKGRASWNYSDLPNLSCSSCLSHRNPNIGGGLSSLLSPVFCHLIRTWCFPCDPVWHAVTPCVGPVSIINFIPSLILAYPCSCTNFTVSNVDILGTKGISCVTKLLNKDTLVNVKSFSVAGTGTLGVSNLLPSLREEVSDWGGWELALLPDVQATIVWLTHNHHHQGTLNRPAHPQTSPSPASPMELKMLSVTHMMVSVAWS